MSKLKLALIISVAVMFSVPFIYGGGPCSDSPNGTSSCRGTDDYTHNTGYGAGCFSVVCTGPSLNYLYSTSSPTMIVTSTYTTPWTCNTVYYDVDTVNHVCLTTVRTGSQSTGTCSNYHSTSNCG